MNTEQYMQNFSLNARLQIIYDKSVVNTSDKVLYIILFTDLRVLHS